MRLLHFLPNESPHPKNFHRNDGHIMTPFPDDKLAIHDGINTATDKNPSQLITNCIDTIVDT